MDASDKEVLFKLSEQLSSMLTPNVSKPLEDLQVILFGDGNLDCAGALNCVREVLCDARFDKKSSKVKKTAMMRQTEQKLLVLEVISQLGDVFFSVASGREPNGKAIKRLDQFLLPQLFLTTPVNSDLLCEIALKGPLKILKTALQKDPQARRIMDDLESTLFSWKTNYGCDFQLTLSAASKDGRQPPPSRLLREVAVSGTVRETPQIGKHLAAACTVWDASSYSSHPTHRSSLHTLRKTPACLLTKRRQDFLDGRYSEVSSSVLSKSINDPSRLNSKAEFSLTDTLSDSEDTDSLSAFETPVKRRKIDTSLFVPPSPDRTHQC